MHHTLQEVGVSLTTLFPIYDRMFKAKVTTCMLASCELFVRVGEEEEHVLQIVTQLASFPGYHLV